jgi:hypothetical protein
MKLIVEEAEAVRRRGVVARRMSSPWSTESGGRAVSCKNFEWCRVIALTHDKKLRRKENQARKL